MVWPTQVTMGAVLTILGNGTAVTGLGGPSGYGEAALTRGDDNSQQVDLSSVFEAGLTAFGSTYDATQIFVNTNGTLSFGTALGTAPVTGSQPPLVDALAPFWGDVDTRLDGEASESGPIWIDLDTSADVVTITWDDVGVYRRNAEDTNTFQLQLYDRGGGDFDAVFRYEQIDWTLGTAQMDAGAHAGLISSRLITSEWITTPGDDVALTALPTTLGNTGVAGLWVYEFRGGTPNGMTLVEGLNLQGTAAGERLEGAGLSDLITGYGGSDTLIGGNGDDTILGGLGADTLNGGAGNDHLIGGEDSLDLRDVIYGTAGDDLIDGGYGNDALHGGTGSDTIEGGYGVDEIIGNSGDDVLTGSAWSDQIFGNDGNDFINGGFGHDRVNGGAGADRFFHIGVAGHGSDWIQDYDQAEGDVLVFGGANPHISQFQVNSDHAPGAGAANLAEAFVIYRPTGQILWALVDGMAQDHLYLRFGGNDYDLFA